MICKMCAKTLQHFAFEEKRRNRRARMAYQNVNRKYISKKKINLLFDHIGDPIQITPVREHLITTICNKRERFECKRNEMISIKNKFSERKLEF